ncbi:MAG: serpin family protein [Bacteroidetes bacterium]|nr:serpin family protein [Bacteroidota bacterium]
MKTLGTLFFAFFLVSVCSCQQDNIETNEISTIELDEKSAQLVEADNTFGLEIFRKIRTESDKENIMISPLSISVALAMTYNGADGETKTEMETVLNLNGLTADDINASYKMLIGALQSLDKDVALKIANAIYYSDNFSVKSDFISTNQNYYDAEVESLNFSSPSSVRTINDWVAEKTNDKILKIIENLSPNDRMILLNAIYFNGIWNKKFDKNGTEIRNFKKKDVTILEIPMMNKEDKLNYSSNELLQAIELPYGNGHYNMVLLLPEDGKTSQNIIEELSTENWKNWMADFETKDNVVVTMPRFKFAFDTRLKEVLKEMGMLKAFSPTLADFTGIANDENLHISSVLHKSFIDVNENGSEAAAVTAVIIGVTSAGPDQIQKIYFTVDKPFVFAITEKDTDAILFIGEVQNPEYKE